MSAARLLPVLALLVLLAGCDTEFRTSCDHGNRVYQDAGGGGDIAVVAGDPTCGGSR